ncbi:23S rRNA (guanosine-2'-O-)-methyltransferase RlmB [Thalictrum thalictroides]|uniref:rRNA methyltransferase 1, mitochondrial n=1 Tax=Thalictrum thalictroides TaxID=46969 RepID=A0A7J6VTH9_THATH|nr:23S rRNA (guanosine-2'-O-)-methyltransferase RlmB [Thalictrum thalictroides]
MYCNLGKSQVVPLVIRISSSSQPKYLKPSQSFESQSFCNGVFLKSLGSLNIVKHRCFSNGVSSKSVENGQIVKLRNFSFGVYGKAQEENYGFGIKCKKLSSGFLLHNPVLLRKRNFSNGYVRKDLEGDSVRSKNSLPWIAAYKNKGGRPSKKVSTEKAPRSSWEESADKVIMANDAKGQVETVDTRDRLREIVESRRSGAIETESRRGSVIERGDGRGGVIERDERRSGAREREERRSAAIESDERRSGPRERDERRSVVIERDEHRSGAMERDESSVADEEIVDDPRWDKIKSRYRRLHDREAENPEFRRWNKQENWGKKTWKEASESTIPRMTGEGVYGVGPILAALLASRREFYTLYVQEGVDLSSNNRKKKDKKGFEKILKIAQRIGLTTKEVSKHDLNMIVDNRPHQGLVLDASPLDLINIRELDALVVEGETGPLWVALDEVTDPQNLGAIIRSSYFFGAAGVVLCAKNSAPLSGVVSKASAGSLELMELRSCKNMMQFLSSSAENGWRVLGGSVSSRAVPLNEISPGAPTILVLGSEGKGLRPLVERSCTDLVRIPGNIPVDVSTVEDEDENADKVNHSLGEEFRSFMAVESLNVSVAAGVLLHHLVGNNTCNVDDKRPSVRLESFSSI